MIALVTGAAGFIGRHVARRLSGSGWIVHGCGHGSWNQDEWTSWGISRWTKADVAVPALRASSEYPDVIVHCAGGASVRVATEQPGEDFARTVGSTSAVLEYLRQHAPEARLVVISSGAVYGSTGDEPAGETQPPRPESIYGCHKLMAEQLCVQYGRFHRSSTAIVRLFSAYGQGLRKQLIWDACEKLSRGQGRFDGAGTEARDWLNVEDAAQLIVSSVDHASPSCPVVNGGTGVSATVREIVSEIADALGTQAPEFTGTERAGDPRCLVADPRLARSWGWRPLVEWRAGVRAYCDWYQRGAQ